MKDSILIEYRARKNDVATDLIAIGFEEIEEALVAYDSLLTDPEVFHIELKVVSSVILKGKYRS